MLNTKFVDQFIQHYKGSKVTFWNYQDACVLLGILSLMGSGKFPDQTALIKQFMDDKLAPDGHIIPYQESEYNLDRIPLGLPLYRLYDKFPDANYRVGIDQLYHQLRHQPRTAEGSFWHKKIYPNQVWLDGLYMALPFYAEYAAHFADDKQAIYDDIMRQFINARRSLWSDKAELYYHAYDETRTIFWADSMTGQSPNFWSRAIGWAAMALVDCFEIMQPTAKAENLKQLQSQFEELIDDLLSYQDPETKLFYQLTALSDVPGNYLETSASAMIAYSLMKGYRLGMLKDISFLTAGEEILLNLEKQKLRLNHGQLELIDICAGAGLGPEGNYERDGSVAYYLAEDRVANEKKGVGVYLMAYGEWLKNYSELDRVAKRVTVFSKDRHFKYDLKLGWKG